MIQKAATSGRGQFGLTRGDHWSPLSKSPSPPRRLCIAQSAC